jgi:ABC-type uncharacterized transport system substrate-binding protein
MAAFVIAAAGPAAAQAQPDSRNQSAVWRVVLMRSSDSLFPVNFTPEKALRAALVEDAPRLIDFYPEEVDPLRFPGAVEADIASLLQRKYANTPVDLVVASGMESLEFAARHRDTIWPGAAIVFNGVLEGVAWRRPPRTTGVTVALDIEGTVALGRSLVPNLRRLHVVSGSAEIERTLLTLAMQKLARLDPPLEVHYLVGLTRAQVSGRVAMLEPGDMVLYLTMLRDADGTASDLTAPAMLQIAASASVPVLSVIQTQYGRGVLGGSSPRYEAHARAAGELARKVLQGADPDAIEVRSVPQPACQVDWHGLMRWQLPAANVPPGCAVLNRPADPLQEYFGAMLAAAAVIVMQAVLLSALLLQGRRRRRAEAQLRAHTAALAHESRMSMVGALTADLAHQINQPMGAILSNTEAAQLMLEQGTLTPDKLREILADIRDDDIRASEVIRTLRALVARSHWRPTALETNTEVAEALRLVAIEAARQNVVIKPNYGADMPAVLGRPGAAAAGGDQSGGEFHRGRGAVHGPAARGARRDARAGPWRRDRRGRCGPGRERGGRDAAVRARLQRQALHHGVRARDRALDRRDAPWARMVRAQRPARRGLPRLASGDRHMSIAPVVPGIVHVVDDDRAFRTAIGRVLSAAGHKPRLYASATDYLSAQESEGPACLIVDLRMPGTNGLDLQSALAAREDHPSRHLPERPRRRAQHRARDAQRRARFPHQARTDRRAAGGDPHRARARHRAQGAPVALGRAEAPLLVAHAARAPGDGRGRRRAIEQADLLRIAFGGENRQDASRARDGEDGGAFRRRARAPRRRARRRGRGARADSRRVSGTLVP